jgi:hypothetical protein
MDGAKARTSGGEIVSICGTAPLKPKEGLSGPPGHPSKSAMSGAAFFVVCIQKAKAVPALSLPRVVVGTGSQRPTGPVGADDDARGHSLRADEREFAWRGSVRKDTFASA